MKRYKEGKKHFIRNLIADKKHLTPIFTSTLNIPERVHDYSDELFIAFNHHNDRFELHSIDAGESTYNSTIPYKALDERTIRHLWKTDIRVHGNTIFKHIEQQEEKREEEKKKEEQNFIRDFGREFRSEFAKDAWSM